MEIIFEGIGSTIIEIIFSLIIGLLTGGFVGYKLGINKTIKQKQKGGKNSTQIQVGNVNNEKK